MSVDVDRTRNRVRATASGATALVEGAGVLGTATEDERRAAAALRCTSPRSRWSSPSPRRHSRSSQRRALAVVDERAVVRLIAPGGVARTTSRRALERTLDIALESETTYGDVGRAVPDVWLLAGARTIELNGMSDAAAAAALAADDIAGLPDTEQLAIIAIPKPP